jgi:hypothetical protein
MSSGRSMDPDDPLAGAPDEVLAAFVALGGRAARLRAANQTPVSVKRQALADAAKMTRPLPVPSPVLNRKA